MTANGSKPSVLCGLIGKGIQSSFTPRMHMREGEAQGMRYVYRLVDLSVLGLEAEALPELLTAAQRMGFDGLNVTFPCKQAVIRYLDDLSEEARALGAVNTVVLKDGKRVGHNTDCSGYGEAFRRHMADARKDRVVQMGAGGAAAAVAFALLSSGVGQLTIFDIEAARADDLAAKMSAHFGAGRAVAGEDIAAAAGAADGLVNTTPVGMEKLPGMPVPAGVLRPDLWVSEIIYFPLETELLRRARALGARTTDGGGMAVFQAAAAFRLFTGVEPDSARMLAHFEALRQSGGTTE
jgi:quinate/shikimate dehydrogenase (NAD+)